MKKRICFVVSSTITVKAFLKNHIFILSKEYDIYMVGNFNEYKEARSHRENIKQKGCSSAFVVAYNGAKRITVQEALMITSQKWFK